MPFSFAKSSALFERAQRSIAAGVNSGTRKLEAPVPLYFERGSGPNLWDVDGNHYLDFQLGQGALFYGHAPAGMADALAAQAKLGTHSAAQCELELDVAERLQAMIPSAELVRFSNSATEAVWTAFRLARAHTRRKLILKFEGHGETDIDEALVRSTRGFQRYAETWKPAA
jgi:glutamate-1-semialdehyde 2,1-aminomutase